jgi:threonylcarbamoyladenosine tRNA methylthiotransferase MtaB
MLRVAITTLGCKVNQADARELLREIREVVREVPYTEQADLYIVNSCTVTATADRQSRQLVHRARRTNPKARVVLTGCLAAVAGEADLARLDLDRVFPFREHHLLVQYIRKLSGGSTTPSPSRPSRARPFLKIQDGCDRACTYCIVPAARGPSRTVATLEEIHRSLLEQAESGVNEVVLTGIHLGRYGADLVPPFPLADLLAELTRDTLPVRLRLSSIEPDEITDDLIRLLVERPDAICPHLHVPIQSGDDAILAAMDRPYRSDRIHDLLADLRARIPDAALGTDLIAGFPGETEAQHRATLQLVRETPLSHLHVFPYSQRPGTPAARLPQLPRRVRAERARELRAAGAEKLAAFASGQLGRTRRVMVERPVTIDGRPCHVGVTDNYLRVQIPTREDLVGRIVDVELVSLAREGQGVVIEGRVRP